MSFKTKIDIFVPPRSILFPTIGLLFVLIPGVIFGEMSKRVGDYRLIFNVIPSILFMDHPKTHPVRQMHGGISGIPKYHFMLTVLNVNTGKRIRAYSIIAKVHLKPALIYQKKLQPMLLNGVLNYGNYFNLNSTDSMMIEFKVQMNETTPPFKVQFHWSLT